MPGDSFGAVLSTEGGPCTERAEATFRPTFLLPLEPEVPGWFNKAAGALL